MGAAGDMLTAALLELFENKEAILEELNQLHIPGVTYAMEVSKKCGICGTHVSVSVNGTDEWEEMNRNAPAHHHPHEHKSMQDIAAIIEKIAVSTKVKEDILSVYSKIAEAESQVHGVPVSEIHFHEVGTMDAIADVAAVCFLMNQLSLDKVLVSPIHVGSGQIKCAHGILPVPAPATAYLLKNVPIYGGAIKGELCTPTGAALLTHFASGFGDMPIMRTNAVGYGMGKKDFEAANCVRAFLGETEGEKDTVVELSCNLDDMTAEAIGFAKECLLAAGALDVYTIPIQMKKSRPGTLLSVMCQEEDKEQMIKLIFQYTTTLGIREHVSKRYILSRSMETVETTYGEVHKKVSKGYGVTRIKYEYEDLARIAREQNISLDDVVKIAREQKNNLYEENA